LDDLQLNYFAITERLCTDASFDWNESEVVIPNLNLQVKKQELVGIVGPVGAGKSSLLQALLGEMPKVL